MRRRAMAALLVVVVAACQSTTREAPSGAPSETPGTDGVAAPVASSPVGDPGGGPADTGPRSTSRSSAARRDTRGPASASGGGSRAALRHGPGVGAKTIHVGIRYLTNTEAYLGAFGVNEESVIDPRKQAQAVIDDINRTGGVAGRRLVPVWRPDSATNTNSYNAQSQAACSHFTEDNKVFAAIPASPPNWSFNDCMHKAGAVLGVASSTYPWSARLYAAYPHIFDVTGLSVDRLSRSLVSMLVRLKYFTPWDAVNGRPAAAPKAKVGVLAPDLPAFREPVTKVLLPALRAAGHQVDPQDAFFYAWPQSNGEIGATITQVQSASLRFRQSGVTHLLPLELSGFAFFAQGAEQQRYRPRYGMNSYTAPSVYSGSLVPYEQLPGSLGLGFHPLPDLRAQDNPDNGRYSSTARRSCFSLMRKANQSVTTATERLSAATTCDLYFSFRDVMRRIPKGEPLTQATFAAARGRVGSYAPAVFPTAFLGPRRPDVVARGWPWVYQTGCRCFTYTGGPVRIP